MNRAGSIRQSGAFVPADHGYRFRLVSEPSDGCPRGTFVFVHAFADEMNRSRRMASRMARLLAADGWRVVQRDLRGCGDSSAEFGDVSWSDWISDIDAELAQAPADRPVWLWCLRAGALLVPAVLARYPRVNLLLWQPVLTGVLHLQQFLRLHAGARIAGTAGRTSEASPAQTLRTCGTVEVGGYQLSSSLAAGLAQASFEIPDGFGGRLLLYELSADNEASASPQVTRLAQRLQARGIVVESHVLQGPSFWQTQEIEECEALLDGTLAAVRASDAVPQAALDAKAHPVPSLQHRPASADSSPALSEDVLSFMCGKDRLWGVLSPPPSGTAEARIAVVIVVGGPQYRAGSHRQFVLLARALAERGFPTLRFDYRGMGDSEGAVRNFEMIGPDMRAAFDAMSRKCPACRLVVWGLCDAASAALMFATTDARVTGIVAANPWARSEASLAATRVKHYYASRLLQREFWSKLLRGGVSWRASLGSFFGHLKQLRPPRVRSGRAPAAASFQARMARGLANFRGRVLLILSGNDLTAKEFLQYAESDSGWRGLLSAAKVSRVGVADADHTFSRRVWHAAMADATIAWLERLAAEAAPSHGSGQGEDV